MIRRLKDWMETARLTRERADRLVEENRHLRELAAARQEEIDRLNKVLDEVTAVVKGWKR